MGILSNHYFPFATASGPKRHSYDTMERLDDQREAPAVAPTTTQKVEVLPGATLDACTFAIHNEDHTLGNALRYITMKDPDVEFCGYSAPHPSEPVIHLRVQMHDNKSAKEAVTKGLDRLEVIFSSIGDAYKEDLAKGEYERYEPKVMNMEAVRKLAEGDEDDNATANQDTTMQ